MSYRLCMRFQQAAIAGLLATVCGAQQPGPSTSVLATPGRPGSDRILAAPVDNDRYRSTIVELGGGARVGLLYTPKMPGPNARVAVLYSNRNFGFDPPAAELASRGHRVLFVSYPPLRASEIAMPLDGFLEASRGISFLRTLPGVERVVAMGWGAGAGSMTLYAALAARGPAACQGQHVIHPCPAEQAAGLARPDGLILLDPGLATRPSNIDPAFDGKLRSRSDLDMYAAANGYDIKSGVASYAPQFRQRYFAAQHARNEHNIDAAIARLKVLEQDSTRLSRDEPLFVPGAVNAGEMASLARADRRILSHTKRPHVLLKADGTRSPAVLHSIRPVTSLQGEAALQERVSKMARPNSDRYTLREFLANDAIRTTKDFALTEDDIVGVDWKSAVTGTPANAAGVAIPTLVMTMTCFQFVVPSEIIHDHLAAADKTLAGVEGADHEFMPCAPQFGDTKRALFGFIADWLGRPGRF
jgi:hypothetical protein